MRCSTLSIVAVLVGALALVAGILAVPITASAATPTLWSNPVSSLGTTRNPNLRPNCANILYVAVRGSAEHNQLGNTLDKVWSNAKARMQADGSTATVRTVYIDYPALSTNWLALDLIEGLNPKIPQGYQNSVAEGVIDLNIVLNNSIKYCPSEKWVLTGYSQGAEVVDQVVHAGLNNSRILGVGLVGDAGNYPGKPVNLIGNNPNPRGDGVMDALLVRYETPAALKSVSWSLCSGGDLICDYKYATRSAAIHQIIGGLNTHSNYNNDPQLARYFSAFADTVYRGWKASTPIAPPVSPIVNIPDAALKQCVLGDYQADFGPQLTDITQVQMAQLTSVDCGEVSDLTGLRYATNVKALDLEGFLNNQPPAGASDLASMKNLASVVMDTDVPDLAPFVFAPNLTTLEVSGTFTSLAPLASMTKLHYFNCTGYVTDVSPAAALPNLSDFYLVSHRAITDVSSLRALSQRAGVAISSSIPQPPVNVGTTSSLPTVIGFDGSKLVPVLGSGFPTGQGTFSPDYSSITWSGDSAGESAPVIWEEGTGGLGGNLAFSYNFQSIEPAGADLPPFDPNPPTLGD